MKNTFNKLKSIIITLKGLLAIGISDVVGGGIQTFFLFYVAILINPEQYGELFYFLSIGNLASAISLLGSKNTLLVYLPKKVSIHSTLYLICIIGVTITTIILFFIFYDVGLSVYVLGSVFFGLAGTEILGRKLYFLYSKFLLTQKILMVTLAIGLFYLMGIDGIILGIGLSLFLYIILIIKAFKESKINFSLVRERFGFMMNNYIITIINTGGNSIDKLILGPLLGFTLLGNYQLGLQFIAAFQIFPVIIFKYILPHDASGNPNKKLKRLSIIASIVFTIALITLSPFVVPFLFPKFINVIEVIQIASVSLIPYTISIIYSSKFVGKEESRTALLGVLIYAITLVFLILFLGSIIGISGAAIGYTLASSLQAAYYVCADKFSNKK